MRVRKHVSLTDEKNVQSCLPQGLRNKISAAALSAGRCQGSEHLVSYGTLGV